MVAIVARHSPIVETAIASPKEKLIVRIGMRSPSCGALSVFESRPGLTKLALLLLHCYVGNVWSKKATQGCPVVTLRFWFFVLHVACSHLQFSNCFLSAGVVSAHLARALQRLFVTSIERALL